MCTTSVASSTLRVVPASVTLGDGKRCKMIRLKDRLWVWVAVAGVGLDLAGARMLRPWPRTDRFLPVSIFTPEPTAISYCLVRCIRRGGA